MSNQQWSKLSPLAATAQGPDELLKLAEGDFFTLAFRGSPLEVPTFYDNRGRHLVAAGNVPPRTRIDVRILANVFEMKRREMRIVELVPRPYNDLLLLQENHPIGAWTFGYSRSGAGLETRYAVVPMRPLTPRERVEIEELPLFALEPFAQKIYGAAEALPGQGQPLTAPTAQPSPSRPSHPGEIESLLAEASPDALSDLLTTFGVGDVVAIPVNRAAAAVAFARALRDEHRAAQADARPRTNNL